MLTNCIFDEPLWLSKLPVASRNSMVGHPFYILPVKLDGRVNNLNLRNGRILSQLEVVSAADHV